MNNFHWKERSLELGALNMETDWHLHNAPVPQIKQTNPNCACWRWAPLPSGTDSSRKNKLMPSSLYSSLVSSISKPFRRDRLRRSQRVFLFDWITAALTSAALLRAQYQIKHTQCRLVKSFPSFVSEVLALLSEIFFMLSTLTERWSHPWNQPQVQQKRADGK